MKICLFLVFLLMIPCAVLSAEKGGASKCFDKISNLPEFYGRYVTYKQCVKAHGRTRYLLGDGNHNNAVSDAKKYCTDFYVYAEEYLISIAGCSDDESFWLIYALDKKDSEDYRKDIINYFVIKDNDISTDWERICAKDNKSKQKLGLHSKTVSNLMQCLSVHGAIKILSGKTNDHDGAISNSIKECEEEFYISRGALTAVGCSENRAQEFSIDVMSQMYPRIKENMQSLYLK